MLVSDAGTVIPLQAVDRPDVRAERPGCSSVGFTGWIDIRQAAAGPWRLRYSQNGRTMEAALPLIADGEDARRFSEAKVRKLAALRPLLRCPLCHAALTENGGLRCDNGHAFRTGTDAYDFLTAEIGDRVGAFPTDNVSAHGYDASLIALIEASSGPVLDVGAGARPDYRDDVFNLEIAEYPTTDVVAAIEFLPFADSSFDLVISVAVLEHVRNPFAAARELVRILRPGGRVFAAVPFLQPYHGYPDHYYNMTAGGLRNVFADLEVERLDVPLSGHPIFALTWIIKSWRAALPLRAAREFEQLRVADLAADPMTFFGRPFVDALSEEGQRELAALNVLVGRKPALS